MPRRLLLALAFVALAAAPAEAQRVTPRVGVGFDALLVPPGQDQLPEGLGLGVRTRVAVPLNADVSAAADMGIAGFVLGGRDQSAYVATPQLSLILTLPGRRTARYLLGGFGGVIPLSDEGSAAPTFHAGIGWARPLSESSLYIEVDPTLVVGDLETTFFVPGRIGVIF